MMIVMIVMTMIVMMMMKRVVIIWRLVCVCLITNQAGKRDKCLQQNQSI